MNFKTAFIALALMGLGAASIIGCGGNACDELADKYSSCADASADGSSDGSTDCTDAQIKAAQCYLDNVSDVCAPTLDELTKVSECAGTGA